MLVTSSFLPITSDCYTLTSIPKPPPPPQTSALSLFSRDSYIVLSELIKDRISWTHCHLLLSFKQVQYLEISATTTANQNAGWGVRKNHRQHLRWKDREEYDINKQCMCLCQVINQYCPCAIIFHKILFSLTLSGTSFGIIQHNFHPWSFPELKHAVIWRLWQMYSLNLALHQSFHISPSWIITIINYYTIQ